MKNLTVILVCLVSSLGFAQGLPSATKIEIDQLFSTLESSNCEFNRNGSWYGAQQASTHLRKKHDYLLKRNLITTAETFIELAATKSSMSGTFYFVRCAKGQQLPSKAWFIERLNEIRRANKKTDEVVISKYRHLARQKEMV